LWPSNRKDFFQTQFSTDLPTFSASYSAFAGRDLWRRTVELLHSDNEDDEFEDYFFEGLLDRRRKVAIFPPRWRRRQNDMTGLIGKAKDEESYHEKRSSRGVEGSQSKPEVGRPQERSPLDQKRPLEGVYQKIRFVHLNSRRTSLES